MHRDFAMRFAERPGFCCCCLLLHASDQQRIKRVTRVTRTWWRAMHADGAGPGRRELLTTRTFSRR